MDNEMIERCARAACKELGSKYTKDEKYGNYTVVEDRTITDIDGVIKAIIKAMHEPTEKMMIEMERAEPQLECFLEKEKSPSYLVWIAAIDAITND